MRQRHLFNRAAGGNPYEVVVVVSEGSVVGAEQPSGLEIDPGYDRTQTTWVTVERLG
jgi:hypothetical protein